jgi:VWFA-related protein
MVGAMTRAFLLLTAVTVGLAQSERDAELPQRLVRLMVAATDAKGDPVINLRASDVQIREDGKLRPAVFFRFDGSNRAAAPPGEGETVNPSALTPTLLLFDRWNEDITLAAQAWTGVGTALGRMESVRRIFIYFLTNHGELYPVHPLPATDADLRALVEPTAAELRSQMEDAVRKLLGFRNPDAYLDPVARANTTFRALSELGMQMASIAGRKNLVWVTRGVPLTVQIPGLDVLDFTPQVRKLSEAAEFSQIAIYTVDESARGVGADPIGLSLQTLQMFSKLTGGRWYSSDDTAGALTGALADGQGNYRIAYYSPIRAKDRKEHKIRLLCSRKSVHLLTREGYYGDTIDPNPDELEQALFASERRSPFDATDLGMRVALSPGRSGGSFHFAIHVNPADVLLEQQGGNYQGELGLEFAFYQQGFLKAASTPVSIDVNLTPDQYAKAQKDGLDVSQDVAVGRDLEKIRVIAFDKRLFGLGSVTVSASK